MENIQTDYKLWCVKLKDLTQIYFLANEHTSHNSLMDNEIQFVLHPMVGTVDETGSIEFSYFVEYSEKDVLIKFDDIRAVSNPVPSIESLYRQAVRRIDFLNKQPESSRKILEAALNELRVKANGGKAVSVDDYKKEIIKQTDKMIKLADGIVEEDEVEQTDSVYDSNVIDITKRKPPLH